MYGIQREAKKNSIETGWNKKAYINLLLSPVRFVPSAPRWFLLDHGTIFFQLLHIMNSHIGSARFGSGVLLALCNDRLNFHE